MSCFVERFLLSAALLACGCGQGDEVHSVGAEVSDNPLYVSEGLVWRELEIPVCWENAGFDDMKRWTREAIEQSWELFSNVDFTGWGRCPSTSVEGIRILVTDSADTSIRGRTLGLGTRLDGVVDGMRLQTWTRQHCGETGYSIEDCVRSSAVHEFGHALGFAHEHLRADNMGRCAASGGSHGTIEVGSFDIESAISYCSSLRNGAGYLTDTDIAGVQMFYGTRKENAFGYDAGGWRSSRHPRMMADVNGDGLQDIVGFGNDGVHVSRAVGRRYPTPEDSFTAPKRYVDAFGYNAGGWRIDKHPRMLADVNGDRKEDAVGFANDGVYVALANSSGTAFGAPKRWIAAYGHDAGGWRVDQHPRMLGDVNGDGRADVVGFANDGVYVSLANSAGTAFGASRRWVAQFGQDHSWNTTQHIRMVIDVNNDRRADIVGFGNAGVYVSLANSKGTAFGTRQLWVSNYAVNSAAGGWRLPNNPRFLARVNGDALPDIVGFGGSHVYVSLNSGKGFAAPVVWGRDRFGSAAAAGGWSASKHIRAVADVNGDKLADVVGFYDKNVIVALARASDFGPSQAWSTGYDVADGWTVTENPRLLAPVDGNLGADIVGFADDGVHSTSLAIHIDTP